jgi:hypothetical protein
MRVRSVGALVVAAAVIGGIAGAVATLVLDRDGSSAPPARGQLVHLAPAVSFPDIDKTPRCFEIHHFCLVQPQPGQLKAFYTYDPHPSFREEGCTVYWDATRLFDGTDRVPPLLKQTGVFVANCSGSVFDVSGHRLYGPSPRDLDEFPVAVTADGIVVNTTHLICGRQGDRPSASCEWAPPIN